MHAPRRGGERISSEKGGEIRQEQRPRACSNRAGRLFLTVRSVRTDFERNLECERAHSRHRLTEARSSAGVGVSRNAWTTIVEVAVTTIVVVVVAVVVVGGGILMVGGLASRWLHWASKAIAEQ